MKPVIADGDPVAGLPLAYGTPLLRGRLRGCPEDFVVEEDLGYVASGRGEHVWLQVRKRLHNTHDVARVLARHAGVPQRAVGYAGLKDRNAVTTQAFTVHLPGQDGPDWRDLEVPGVEVLAAERHHRKIRRGALRGNRFTIRITDIGGSHADAEQRLRTLAEHGVPNYFGSQRFGREGRNLARFDVLRRDPRARLPREQRGLVLSAARAQLFNAVLAERVRLNRWGDSLPGDVFILAGTRRQFLPQLGDPEIPGRLQAMDVHPSGPLCGCPSRALRPTDEAAQFEEEALQPWQEWMDALCRFGLDADRRALRLAVEALTWSWTDSALQMQFELVAGSYATVALREVVSPLLPAQGGNP